jgi:hypothetical protein
MQQQQQQQSQSMADDHQVCLSVKQDLKLMNTYMHKQRALKNFGTQEGKSFVEPQKASDNGVHLANVKNRKSIESAHSIAQTISDLLIKYDKAVVKAQENTFEHSVLLHKLKNQKIIQSNIVDTRKENQFSMQGLRDQQKDIQRKSVVIAEEEEDYFNEDPDLT